MQTNKVTETDVHSRLAELGLTTEVLEQALMQGEYYRSTCTPHTPKNVIGMTAWGEIVKSLRDQLVPQGWFSEVINGVEIVTKDDRSVSIAVASGNSSAGNKSDELVRSKYPRGFATVTVVQNNAQQLTMDFITPEVSGIAKNGTQVWYILYSRDSGTITYELSLPYEINEDMYMSAFAERIICPAIDVDKVSIRNIEKDFVPQQAEEIFVDVSLKNNA